VSKRSLWISTMQCSTLWVCPSLSLSLPRARTLSRPHIATSQKRIVTRHGSATACRLLVSSAAKNAVQCNAMHQRTKKLLKV
jgi:hypothetical protein